MNWLIGMDLKCWWQAIRPAHRDMLIWERRFMSWVSTVLVAGTWWFIYKCAFWNSLSCGFIVLLAWFSCTIWAQTEFVNPLAIIRIEFLGCNNCNCISPGAANQSAEENAVYKYCLRIQISLQIWKDLFWEAQKTWSNF